MVPFVALWNPLATHCNSSGADFFHSTFQYQPIGNVSGVTIETEVDFVEVVVLLVLARTTTNPGVFVVVAYLAFMSTYLPTIVLVGYE